MDGARLAQSLTRRRPSWLVKRFARFQAWFLRTSRGRYRRSRALAGGQPVLSITTTGRKSGQQRSTIIAYLADPPNYAVFGMFLGSKRDPAWSLNLAANPEAEIVVEGRRMRVRARPPQGEEAKRLWAANVARLPAAEHFREISGREIPIFVLEPLSDG